MIICLPSRAITHCSFDDEDDLELVGRYCLTSVQVEWILLENRMVKKYYFERTKGVWMLEAINLRQIEQGENEDFVAFYLRFVTDSVYQSRHIREPLEYITIDPDDEFSIPEDYTRLESVVCFPSGIACRQTVQYQLRTKE